MHTHRPSRAAEAVKAASRAFPFSGPVRFPGERGHNERAHGNVRFGQACACGAIRSVNVNGWHRETGRWIEAE